MCIYYGVEDEERDSMCEFQWLKDEKMSKHVCIDKECEMIYEHDYPETEPESVDPETEPVDPEIEPVDPETEPVDPETEPVDVSPEEVKVW